MCVSCCVPFSCRAVGRGANLLSRCAELEGVDAIPWDAATPMCSWVPRFLRTPQLQNVFGLLQFDVFGDSREFCNSDIMVPLTRMQAEGKNSESNDCAGMASHIARHHSVHFIKHQSFGFY